MFQCKNCQHGTYKSVVGTLPCAACAVDTFSSSERPQDLLIPTRTTGTVRTVTASVQGDVLLGLALSTDASVLYVADTNNHRIKRVPLSANGDEASPAVVIVGQAVGSANGVGTQASLNEPTDIDLSPDGGALLVADAGNHLVRKIFVQEQGGAGNAIALYSTFSLGSAGLPGHVDGSDSTGAHTHAM